MNYTDWTGTIGVTVLLAAFLLNLFNRVSKDGLTYIILNIAGAAIACCASVQLRYTPFIILEAVWTAVSSVALLNYYRKRNRESSQQ